jgi:hypothetical protein
MSGLKVVEYSKKDFRSIARDEEFWTRSRLPISRRRCIAQALNPRADESDVLLIAAYGDGELVSYIGILPDWYVGDDTGPVKFGWLTTWWTDKNSKHRLAATMVLFSAIKRYSGRVAISSFTLDAKRIYDSSRRFSECARLEPVYFIMALPTHFRVIGVITKWFSGLKNGILFMGKRGRTRLEIETVAARDEGLELFIDRWSVADPFARNLSLWRWVWGHPWISGSSEDKAQKDRYQFSVFSKCFKHTPIVVRRDGDIIGLLVMKLRDGRLSLLFALYDPQDRDDIAEALKLAVIDINPWVFISSDKMPNTTIRRGVPFYAAALRRDPILVYASFPLELGAQPQYGIGDNIFT